MDVVSDFKNLKMITGWAKFKDNKTIVVDGKAEYTSLKFIIATGATTNIPNIEGLNEIGYLTNVSLFDFLSLAELGLFLRNSSALALVASYIFFIPSRLPLRLF